MFGRGCDWKVGCIGQIESDINLIKHFAIKIIAFQNKRHFGIIVAKSFDPDVLATFWQIFRKIESRKCSKNHF